MTINSDSEFSPSAFLDTVEGEITLFRSIMRARPVGIHRHFHVLTIRNAIYKDTGRLIPPDDIWQKLRSCWDMDALENIDTEADHYLEASGSNNSTPSQIPSPSPSDNLDDHKFFREEFSLPSDEMTESLIIKRRMRNTPSEPSTRSPSPVPPPKRKRTRRNNLEKAGLVAESDSSALTQSGDEGTEDGEEDEAEQEGSPTPSSSKPGRGRPKGAKKRGSGLSTRGRGAKTTSRGTTKKKKR
ncbi:EAF7 family protein [Pleurotus pulmonarius]